MSYDPQQEKQKIYEILSQFQEHEQQMEKRKYLKMSIALALDELEEFEQLYRRFLKEVGHLVVYQEIIKDPLVRNMENLLRDLRFLIEKNYTKEELEQVPSDVYQQIIQSQKQRAELLKKIARKYLMHSSHEE
jgi:NifB/MoaA-like Fe-S oxidoreductase